MTTERAAMAALLERAKYIVMETFDFARAVRIMEVAAFGWISHYDASERVAHARRLLSGLIDGKIQEALEHIDRREAWDFLWTNCGGFFVTLSPYGIIQAHLSLESSDSYDCDELKPFYEQLAAARGRAVPPHHEMGGRRRILLLTE